MLMVILINLFQVLSVQENLVLVWCSNSLLKLIRVTHVVSQTCPMKSPLESSTTPKAEI